MKESDLYIIDLLISRVILARNETNVYVNCYNLTLLPHVSIIDKK